jgi:hypothetical protein
MGFTAFIGIVLVALFVGVGIQYLMGGTVSYEWFVVALAGALGAYLASEWIVVNGLFGITNWGPELDGLFVVPAAIGGVLLALSADFGVRMAVPQTSSSPA